MDDVIVTYIGFDLLNYRLKVLMVAVQSHKDSPTVSEYYDVAFLVH